MRRTLSKRLRPGGEIWDYVLFDPWGHTLHGVGFFLQLLAILMIFVGVPLGAVAIIHARTVVSWQLAIPILWFLYILGLLAHIFANDKDWLFPRFGIDRGERGISADTALRLARFFGKFVEYWTGIHTHYKVEKAKMALAGRLQEEVKVFMPA